MSEVAKAQEEWRLPQELAQPAPRPVRRRQERIGELFWFGGEMGGVLFISLGAGLTAARYFSHAKNSPYLGMACLASFLLAGGVIVAVFFKTVITRPKNLLRWGEATPGQVIRKRPDYSVLIRELIIGTLEFGRPHFPLTDYSRLASRATYQFRNQSGKVFIGKSRVRSPVGEAITVLYDPKNPKCSCGYPAVNFEVSRPENSDTLPSK